MKKYFWHNSHRLKNYNYSSNGSYFITICVKNKECLLGDIVAGGSLGAQQINNPNDLIYQKATNAKMILSDYGKITQKYINSSNTAYENLKVDNYVIMPNHIHIILSVSNNVLICKSKPWHDIIPTYVSSLKSLITKEIGFPVFQRNYHDHIIRDENEYEKIWDYVNTNVSNWVADRFYMY